MARIDSTGVAPMTFGINPLIGQQTSLTTYTGRLQSISWYCGTTTVYHIAYGYNANDQRTSATETRLLADGSTETRVYAYTYDSYDHLSGETILDGSGTLLARYAYPCDALGNRTDTGFTVNALNQYTFIGGFTEALQYDSRGNLTLDNKRTMTYDAQDQLRSVVRGRIKEEYDYDYQGRRTVKRTFGANGTGGWTLRETRTFAYDGWNLIAEFITDATHTTPTLARSYAWGIGLGGGVGGLLSVTDHLATGGPQTYVPIFDGNGNVMGLTDSLGQVAATYTYDPYGTLRNATGPAVNVCPFHFATMYDDDGSALYYGKMRYYSSDLGRWITRDPAEEDGGVNLYEYCGDDPVNAVDPTGMAPQDTTGPDGNLIRFDQQAGRLSIYAGQSANEADQIAYTSPRRAWTIVVSRNRELSRVGWTDKGGSHQQINEKITEPSPALQAWAKKQVPEFVFQINKYFDAAEAQQIEDKLRLAGVYELADKTATFLDAAIRLVPGSSVMLDAPEVVTGRSSTIAGKTISGGQRVFVGTMVVGAAVLAWSRMGAWASEVNFGRGLPSPRIAELWRNTPGLATGADLPLIRQGQRWLRGSGADAGRVPGQIASRLAGRKFETFREFREAFWREVANDPVLRTQFGANSLREMQAGRAAFSPAVGRVGERLKYELDHLVAIEDGGAVYDMHNLIIRTPANHIGR